MQTLKEIGCGQTVTVLKITGTGAIKRRIMDMGITKGTEIRVRKVAPLGDPRGGHCARIRVVSAQSRCGNDFR